MVRRGAMVSLGRRLRVDLRYFVALLRRFRTTMVLAVVLFGLGPVVYHVRHVGADGQRVSLGKALRHVYFLLYGQPSLDVDDSLLMLLDMAIPPVGIALLADGLVRFAYLFFAKHHQDKEWF